MTDKEKLYAVKNDKGEWLSFDSSHESVWYTNNPTFFNDKSYAEAQSGHYGHVVELVEAPAKVVVSEEEAEMLEQAKDDYCAASVISAYSTEHIGAMGQDRLMRAYVIGWTVEKPKRFVLPMEGTVDEDSEYQMYAIVDSGIWGTVSLSDSVASPTVTQANIDAAPAWVKSLTPIEVTDDEQ